LPLLLFCCLLADIIAFLSHVMGTLQHTCRSVCRSDICVLYPEHGAMLLSFQQYSTSQILAQHTAVYRTAVYRSAQTFLHLLVSCSHASDHVRCGFSQGASMYVYCVCISWCFAVNQSRAFNTFLECFPGLLQDLAICNA
jgi:hypothetical protein